MVRLAMCVLGVGALRIPACISALPQPLCSARALPLMASGGGSLPGERGYKRSVLKTTWRTIKTPFTSVGRALLGGFFGMGKAVEQDEQDLAGLRAEAATAAAAAEAAAAEAASWLTAGEDATWEAKSAAAARAWAESAAASVKASKAIHASKALKVASAAVAEEEVAPAVEADTAVDPRSD